ncbi:hypothetical protein BDW02DRAFT_190103 [Decorospora gaudefroyi]|uniref:Uncharacterized protein n=1 Tax=Decorospora gaudefroyi TaxID=184978 RepID=A0A6A5KRN0_9PLEO|nr:hypothetical protein BDW02DRAFT_190103 [Decorospora gaudefroyi]
MPHHTTTDRIIYADFVSNSYAVCRRRSMRRRPNLLWLSQSVMVVRPETPTHCPALGRFGDPYIAVIDTGRKLCRQEAASRNHAVALWRKGQVGMPYLIARRSASLTTSIGILLILSLFCLWLSPFLLHRLPIRGEADRNLSHREGQPPMETSIFAPLTPVVCYC